jgi:hypothetical protein
MNLDDLKHAQRERLLYLDRCFTWRGRANRRDLMDRFEVSVAQAAIDFRTYLSLAGRAGPVYDRERKTYVARPDHRPLVPEATLGGWEGAVRDRAPDEFSQLPLLTRAAEPTIMARLSRAMVEGEALQIRYTSMTTGEDGQQWIAPTRFASDGVRIHVRAYSFKHNEYRDYVPARIHDGTAMQTRPAPSPMPFDADWHTTARIRLAPLRSLSPDQARAVRREFGFKAETLTIEIRKALEFYIERRWDLKQKGSRLEIVSVDYVPRPDARD